MASNPPPAVEDCCNTETEEETAFKKKRSRRVSFADREITSVHYFNRDEDYETPPNSSARKPSSDGATEAEKEVLGFFRDIDGSDDSREISPDLDEDDGDDVVNARRSFLRPIEFPSPGSSVLGSATSNDEENFFGPVSASFIKPDQLDDAVLDDNHDVTMDSTAFSMHYRSLARSESGGSILEEKTPSQAATPSDSGGSMVLTNVKKMNPCFSISGKASSGRDSNDMSLVGLGPRNYGFGKLSPTLEALLAASSKDLQEVPVSDSPSRNTSKRNEISMFDDNVDDRIDQRDDGYKKAVNIGKLGLSPQGATICMESDEFLGNSLNSPHGLIATHDSSHGHEDLTASTFVDQQMQTPNQMVQVNSFCGEDVNGLVTLNVEVPTGVHPGMNGKVPQVSYLTPSPKQPNFLGKGKANSVDKFVSANKSVSKFQICEPSPIASALKEQLGSLELRLSKFSSTSPYNVVMKIIDDENNAKEISLPDELVSPPGKPLEKVLFSSTKQSTPLHGFQPDGLVSMSLGQDKSSAGKVISNSNSTFDTDVARASSFEESAQSASLGSRKTKKNAKMPIMRVMSKNLVEEPTHNPSRIEVSGSENVKSFDGTIVVSPISSANCPVYSGDHSDAAHNLGASSERKRKFEESVAVDADKYRIVNRSPEIHKSQDDNPKSIIAFDNTRKNTRSDKTMRHWSEILQKFLEDTEQLVSFVPENVNINTLSRMQDVVSHMQKAKFFELLRSQIQSRPASSPSSEMKNARLAETKMLLYKLVYEKARLQLMRMERDKVLKKSQQLRSAVQKSQMLKLNRPRLFLPHSRDSAVDNLRLACNTSGNLELSREKLAAMKLENEALNRKINNLTKSFSNYLKIKGDPSCFDIIAQLNAHVKKKTVCKIVQKELQPWEVVDFASTNLKQKTITLNYRGLFRQRFVINDGPPPSIFVFNDLNDANIRKNFPGIDVCAVFAWVLNARSSKKLDGFKSFGRETQLTSSLLGNMSDVIGEVQLALVELRNLVQTRFHASVEELQLQLCFMDFDRGWKVTVTLDLTCLNRGVYPSDIVLSQVEASKFGTSIAVPDVVSARITAAIAGARAGYCRIIRLCRSLSQAMCSP